MPVCSIPEQMNFVLEPRPAPRSDLVEGVRAEKERRVYYQNIVYEMCNLLDMHLGNAPGKGIVCGKSGDPSDELQQALCDVLNVSRAALTTPAPQTPELMKCTLDPFHCKIHGCHLVQGADVKEMVCPKCVEIAMGRTEQAFMPQTEQGEHKTWSCPKCGETMYGCYRYCTGCGCVLPHTGQESPRGLEVTQDEGIHHVPEED